MDVLHLDVKARAEGGPAGAQPRDGDRRSEVELDDLALLDVDIELREVGLEGIGLAGPRIAARTAEERRPGVLKLPSDQDASGRTLGQEELERVRQVLASGVLTSIRGTAVRAFESRFAATLRVAHAYACSSGTAAIHAAVAAIDPEPGDEIVTSPITDMGALTPILYQGAIPVFADVDPRTCKVTTETIAARLSRRTRAILVTHLFGNPAPMGDIMALAEASRLPVIEDCAQAFCARVGGRVAGTIGTIGCFSLQQGKHITTGEGGIVICADEQLARRVYLFINKAWGYGDPAPDHTFLALNYRMSELQGAVALAQLHKLSFSVRRRAEMASLLTAQLAGIDGLRTPWVAPGAVSSFWKYCLWVDGKKVPGGNQALGKLLRERGIACAPRYIQKPAFECEIFRRQRTFGRSRFPFTLARPEALDYSPGRFPGTYRALDEILVLPWNERYAEEHVALIAGAVRDAVAQLQGGKP
jgi:perosamine synthetase